MTALKLTSTEWDELVACEYVPLESEESIVEMLESLDKSLRLIEKLDSLNCFLKSVGLKKEVESSKSLISEALDSIIPQ